MAGRERRTAYHVAGEGWNLGEPLLSWDELRRRGYVTADDWHWETYVGHDGELVCVYDTLDSAISHYATRGGAAILEITIPKESDTEAGFHGFGRHLLTGQSEPVYGKRSVERFAGFDWIPGTWIKAAFVPVAEGREREAARVAAEEAA
jgi:hypothetical protein